MFYFKNMQFLIFFFAVYFWFIIINKNRYDVRYRSVPIYFWNSISVGKYVISGDLTEKILKIKITSKFKHKKRIKMKDSYFAASTSLF